MEYFARREKECFNFLKAISKNRKYVLIGGYAVSSFHFPRFSVDLDITIPEEELNFFEKIIRESGFKMEKEKKDFPYGGEYRCYVKGRGIEKVSIDLLINGVQVRQTNHFYKFEYIFKNSIFKEVRGYGTGEKAIARVADKEMLIALKINSMVERMADMRDVITLCYEKPNVVKIFNHLKKCPKDIIIEGINKLLNICRGKSNKDAIKGSFGIDDHIYEKLVKNTVDIMEELKKNVVNYSS